MIADIDCIIFTLDLLALFGLIILCSVFSAASLIAVKDSARCTGIFVSLEPPSDFMSARYFRPQSRYYLHTWSPRESTRPLWRDSCSGSGVYEIHWVPLPCRPGWASSRGPCLGRVSMCYIHLCPFTVDSHKVGTWILDDLCWFASFSGLGLQDGLAPIFSLLP